MRAMVLIVVSVFFSLVTVERVKGGLVTVFKERAINNRFDDDFVCSEAFRILTAWLDHTLGKNDVVGPLTSW